LTDLFIRSQ